MVTIKNETHAFASKTHIPPYGAPQFRLSSEPLRRTQAAEVTPPCRRRDSTRAKVHQMGQDLPR